MLTLSAAAAETIGVVLRAHQVPALRVRWPHGEPTGSSPGVPGPGVPGPSNTATVVETEAATSLGPGEVAVIRGPATVYVPASLAEAHPWSVLDAHHHAAHGGPPGLVLRASAATDPDHLPVTPPRRARPPWP